MQDKREIDPITFEVIRNAFLTAAGEMKMVVIRSSYSPIWREGGDLSCGLLTPGAELVAQGPADLPAHLATMPFSVQGAIDKIPLKNLHPGDVLFSNAPEWGNNHLPDCLMAKPVFLENEIIGFSAVRGHWADIGGVGPGSYTTVTTEHLQEGLRIPPVKIYKQGKVDDELLDLILENTRGRPQRLGDLRAQHAGCLVGEKRILELVQKYGRETVLTCMEMIMDHSEKLTRFELEKIPDGTYHFTDYCDGDGITDQPIKIKLALTVAGSDVVVDFAGSEEQVTGGMNAPLAVTASAIQFAVKAATDPLNPTNSGCYRPVKILAPEGSVVNPIFPASVIAGNHETAMTIVSTVFGALDQASGDQPERVIACGSGSSVAIVIASKKSQGSKKTGQSIMVVFDGGAWGARYNKDGISSMRDGVGNTGNTPIEVLETEYPIMIESHDLVIDGGGAGKYRGGLPGRRMYRTLVDATMTITAERGRIAPFGLRGGEKGLCAEFIINPGTKNEKSLFTKTPLLTLQAGDVLLAHPAGGGGFGKPKERDPVKVRMDVINGYVSLNSARELYGVHLDADTYEILELER
ncbi:hydantoinase B/oxoprolinase family protein [Thermodesulfobacteriota bacterium]